MSCCKSQCACPTRLEFSLNLRAWLSQETSLWSHTRSDVALVHTRVLYCSLSQFMKNVYVWVCACVWDSIVLPSRSTILICFLSALSSVSSTMSGTKYMLDVLILQLLPLCTVLLWFSLLKFCLYWENKNCVMRRRKLQSFRLTDMTWSYKRLRVMGVFRALRANCQVRGRHLEQKLSSDVQDEKNNRFVFSEGHKLWQTHRQIHYSQGPVQNASARPLAQKVSRISRRWQRAFTQVQGPCVTTQTLYPLW